jgi:hypothetical protein
VRALITADTGSSAALSSPAHVAFDTKSKAEKMVLEGLSSGESSEITAEDWNEKRRQLTLRHSKPGSV